jgi:lactoylglutathione lyase
VNRIEHVGLWVSDIDAVTAFYAKFFAARIGELYQNPRKGFESRFLEFGSGARREARRCGAARRGRVVRAGARGDRGG